MRAPALLLVAVGCGPKAPPPPPLDPATAHIGVWHGTGMAYPAGELCLVFCPGGQLYSQSGPCGALDQAQRWSWSREGELLRLHAAERDVAMRFQAIDRNSALIDIPSFPALPLDRVGDLHALCMDPTVRP